MKFTTNSNIYEVQEIIGRKLIKGKLSYFVKWKGYQIEESTWEPIENLTNAPLCIELFEKKRQLQKKKSIRQKKVTNLLMKVEKMKKKKQFNIFNVFPCIKTSKKNQEKIQQATQLVPQIDSDCIEIDPNTINQLNKIKNQQELVFQV